MLRVYLVLVLLLTLVDAREHEISLNEETPIGSEIFDLNTLSSFPISYQLLESSSFFVFNSSTNRISIARRIDRDTLCPTDFNCSKCFLTMKFYDMFHYEIVQLIFSIVDLNDNSPHFSSTSYSLTVAENNLVGIRLRLSQAEDIDCRKNSVQSYELTYLSSDRMFISSISLHSIEEANEIQSSNDFSLVYDRSSSELFLQINRTLDRELQSEYSMTITAKDALHRVSTQLILTVLDVNDHSARFLQSIYSVNLSQSYPAGRNFLRLTAVDDDQDENGRIFYSILSIDGHPNRRDIFQINSQTGDLRLIKSISPTDSKRVWKLIVAASDGTVDAIPSLATVYVNLLPQSRLRLTFGSNRVVNNRSAVLIDENLPNATFVAYVTSDQPIRIDAEGIFLQNLTENSFTLLTDRSYDREERNFYPVRIRSKDEEIRFQIIVNDVNDHRPKWNDERIGIDLEELNDRSIRLNVTDEDQGMNSQIGYRSSSPFWSEWISVIDHNLVLNLSNETDRFFDDEILLELEAFDHGQPELSSTVKLRLYRHSTKSKVMLLLLLFGCLTGLIVVVFSCFVCFSCRKRREEKISELSEDITVQTSTVHQFDAFWYYPSGSMNKSSESLANQLFHSIQTDLSFLTDTTAHSGTYV